MLMGKYRRRNKKRYAQKSCSWMNYTFNVNQCSPHDVLLVGVGWILFKVKQ